MKLRSPIVLLSVLVVALAFAGCSRDKKKTGPSKLVKDGTLVFQDDFERGEFGDRWKVDSPSWKISGGWLHDTSARNEGAWLLEELPEQVRIEFKARSEMPKQGGFRGDMKCEVFAAKPEHQAGYILIFGGWENSVNAIARLDEHGDDRQNDNSRSVVAGQTYEWAIVRKDGKLRWYLDGELFMTYDDKVPLEGRHFGFNNWTSDVYFDDLKVYQL